MGLILFILKGLTSFHRHLTHTVEISGGGDQLFAGLLTSGFVDGMRGETDRR